MECTRQTPGVCEIGLVGSVWLGLTGSQLSQKLGRQGRGSKAKMSYTGGDSLGQLACLTSKYVLHLAISCIQADLPISNRP